MSRSTRTLPLVVAAALAYLPAIATDYTWSLETGSGNFTTLANWTISTGTPTVLPVSGDKVTIAKSSSTVLIGTGDVIALGELAFSAGFMNISGGTITASANQTLASSSGTGDEDYELRVSGGATWSTSGQFIFKTDSLITGSGTKLSANDYVVFSANSHTTLSDGAKIEKLTGTNRLIIGDNSNATVTLFADTAETGTAITSAGDLYIGWKGGTGTVTLNGYASISTSNSKTIFIGQTDSSTGGTGIVTMNGNATLTGANEIWVGNGTNSVGTLNIYDSAVATSQRTDGNFHIGRNAATGTINVGSATANDADGKGKLVALGHLMLAESSGGKAYINVNAHGKVQVSSNLLLGNSGSGTITLSENAALSVGGETKVGVKSGSSGTLNVGDNSSVTLTGYFGIGHSGSGTVTVANDASLTANDTSIGRDGGTGSLSIKDRATVSLKNLKIGQYSQSGSGTVTMNGDAADDTGAVLNISNGISVGYYHSTTGTMTMQGKSVLNVTGGDLIIGDNGATGTLNISDTSSVVLANQIHIGYNGTDSNSNSNSKGTLTMSDNAKLTSTATGSGTVGGGSGAQATVSLSGTTEIAAGNMKWTVGDFGSTSNSGSASITLADSSRLTLRELTIGHLGGTSGSTNITVEDDAILTVNNFITLGRDDSTAHGGQASHLNLNGGVLATKYIQAGGGTTASTNNIVANGGTIRALENTDNFFRIATKATTSGGITTTDDLATTTTHVVVNEDGLTFDTQEFTVGIATAFSGTGTLTKTGTGTLSLDTDFAGNITVTSGTLYLSGSYGGTINYDADLVVQENQSLFLNGTFAGKTIVQNGGTLGGTGSLGDITVQSGGILSPGNSPGTLTADDVLLASGATLELEYSDEGLDLLYAESVVFEEGSTLLIQLNGNTLVAGDTIQFFDNSTTVTNLTADKIQTSEGSYTFSVDANGKITVIPEPSTYALVGAVSLLGIVALRRRRS